MGEWMSPKEISRRLSMSDSTVTKHITALFKAGKIDRQGKSRNIQYRAIFDRGKNMPQANSENLFYDND
jgi:DNA-binding transcriptional ArsR family regulator